MAAEGAASQESGAGSGVVLNPMVLLPIHEQTRLADLLSVTARIVYAAGCPVVIGSLLRDGGTGLWHLTALLDAEGDVVPPEELGIPQQPFAFAVPAEPSAQPLGAVLDAAWKPVPGRTHDGVDQALTICVPIGEAAAPAGALLVLLAEPAMFPLVMGIASHAALAAGRLLNRQVRPQSGAILDARTLESRAEGEIARAKRYQRPLAVVVCQFDDAGTALLAGERIARGLRRWDTVGRVEDNEAMWVRGAPAGPGPATVRCPACGMIYRWSVPAADDRPPDEPALQTLREVLLRTCPSHPAIVLAPPRDEGGKRGLFGRLRR